MGELDGRAALITGGSSGIGAATAHLFAREGATVGVIDRSLGDEPHDHASRSTSATPTQWRVP